MLTSHDECVDTANSDTLLEQICQEGSLTEVHRDCLLGCHNNACRTCRDNDGYIDIFTASSVDTLSKAWDGWGNWWTEIDGDVHTYADRQISPKRLTNRLAMNSATFSG